MFSRWAIRYKLTLCLAMLIAIVGALSFSSFQGVYSYRRLARSISTRAKELPLTEAINQNSDDLQTLLNSYHNADGPLTDKSNKQFNDHLNLIEFSTQQYNLQLSTSQQEGEIIGNIHQEQELIRDVNQQVQLMRQQIRRANQGDMIDSYAIMGVALGQIKLRTAQLPKILQNRMDSLVDEVRLQYRTWIVITWITSITAAILLIQVFRMVHTWIVRPFGKLIAGSRRVASGDLEYEIVTDTDDEVSELALAMNNMTRNFKLIRDDLDQQVKIRTQEAIRSEQLASVGFLAAGVSHEINTPLATIAICAESLETRVAELIAGTDSSKNDEQINIIQKYLRQIQQEAFRCKGITEQLLDFSRGGDIQRQSTELSPIIRDTVDMIQHLGKYKQKQIAVDIKSPATAMVHSHEIKQAVLNLVTNALDSISSNGHVMITLDGNKHSATITVSDDGCGMTEEVLKQVFEPFFTRRQSKQGTGLGLSITYRIISEHGGTITAASQGINQGSVFTVKLPITTQALSNERDYGHDERGHQVA
ncbi:MAG: HAMP domain-containing protein [Planctomycetaceae bacterium]|nr:HAMP domain-containing protein [Planctomycetaceae bacterium]